MAKTKADPTGQAKSRRIGIKKILNRLIKAKFRIKKLFKDIPRTHTTEIVIVNKTTVFYDYEVDDQYLSRLKQDIKNILNEELLETTTGQLQADWYWGDNVELADRQGAVEEVVTFNQLIAAAILAGFLFNGFPPREIDVIVYLQSPDRKERLLRSVTDHFDDISGLSNDLAAKVYREINNGMGSGNKPSDILAAIDKRFEVGDLAAKRKVDTGINKAFNDAKMEASLSMAVGSGLEAGVIHISALLPTTRAHHASRHGLAYTVNQQKRWWDKGANRINCHCTVKSVLINSDGSVVDTESQDNIKQEGKKFFNR